MSSYVKRVHFKLHESYANSNRGKRLYVMKLLNNFALLLAVITLAILRFKVYIMSFIVITKPPYEVTETGWGEFEVVIKIYFHDPNERPVS